MRGFQTDQMPVSQRTPTSHIALRRTCSRGDKTRSTATPALPSSANDVLASPGQPLDAATRALMESRFGHDFSRVRIHTDARATDAARSVHALAYTVGNDVVFGAGHYTPQMTAGQKLIAHELAHVIQQTSTSGHLRPAGVGLLARHQHEQEAEAAANRIVSGQNVQVPRGSPTLGLQRQAAGQGKNQDGDCSAWERDPESFSIRVARHFVATQVNPARAKGPVSTTCDKDRNTCLVTFGDDLVVDVTWNPSSRRVDAGRQIDHGRQWCVYDYRCDAQNTLTLITVRCSGSPNP
jgi:hypothetical protein